MLIAKRHEEPKKVESILVKHDYFPFFKITNTSEFYCKIFSEGGRAYSNDDVIQERVLRMITTDDWEEEVSKIA